MPARDAVPFDLDSTLCVSEQSDHAIHEAVFDRVDVELFFSPAAVRAVEVTELPDIESDRERYVHLYRAAAAAAAEAGAGPDERVLEALADATLDVYDSTLVSYRDGAGEALEYARERYAVGLLTNGSSDTQGAKLDRLGVADASDAMVFCGPGTGYPSKPDPEPFVAVLAGLDVPAERAVYVGDRLDGDVAGAHNAGLDPAWVPMGEPPADPDPEPTYLLESPAALSDVL